MPLFVLEGIDGSGKSTQARRLHDHWNANGRPCRLLREPGGTALGERARALLLDSALAPCPAAELFGFLQARAQLVHEILKPALARGELLLMDRFFHSTIAYQCFGRGLDRGRTEAAMAMALDGLRPDRVLWLYLDPVRAAERSARRSAADRMEADAAFQRRVHEGYATLAAEGALTAVDGDADEATVEQRLLAAFG